MSYPAKDTHHGENVKRVVKKPVTMGHPSAGEPGRVARMAILSGVAMEWKQIRAELQRAVQAAKHRGMTQASIAAAGGLSRQNYVSKALSYGDDSLGPETMNLLRLIDGLGMKVSEFFTIVEQRAAGESPPLPTMARPTAEERLEREVGRRYLQLHHLALTTKPRPTRRKSRSKRS